jgi:hypothetical protein
MSMYLSGLFWCGSVPEGHAPDLESENARLREENARLRAEVESLKRELLSLRTTVSAVVARGIGARADTGRSRLKKPGRRAGHVGAGRSRPDRVDATVELDQTICPRCGARPEGQRASG